MAVAGKRAGAVRRKHVPMRTCIVCRRSLGKRELVRVVRTPEGEVAIDATGKRAGRGAYLCHCRTCWDQAVKRKSLERALKAPISAEDYGRLAEFAESLTEEACVTTGEQDASV